MIKHKPEHIEIINNDLVFRPYEKKSKDILINYLKKHHFIESIIKIKKIPNLYKIKFFNKNNQHYVFITDICNHGWPNFNRLYEKRVYIKKENDALLNFIKNHEINFVAGYCEFGNHVFLFSNSKYLVMSQTQKSTAAPIDMNWLIKASMTNDSFIVTNTNKGKYDSIFVTNSFNEIENIICHRKKLNDFKVLDNKIDFKYEKDLISNFMQKLSQDEEIKQKYNLKQEKKYTFKRNFLEIKTDGDLLKLHNVSNYEIKTFGFNEIMKRIEAYNKINPLKIEKIFDELISYDKTMQKCFNKITGETYKKHIWNNGEQESFKPYDFLINNHYYVDVKSTWKDHNASFFISNNENKIRENNKNNYIIALFYDIHFNDNDELKYKFKMISNYEIEQLEHSITYQYFINKK